MNSNLNVWAESAILAIRQVPWETWVQSGEVPLQLNALLGVVDELSRTSTKRSARLGKMMCRHLNPVYDYANMVLQRESALSQGFMQFQYETTGKLDKWITHETMMQWSSVLQPAASIVLRVLKALEQSILMAFTKLSHQVLLQLEKIRETDRIFADQRMMELVLQWSDVALDTVKDDYIYEMAIRFGETALEVGGDEFWWIGHIVSTFIRAAPLWLESFFADALITFSGWYSELFIGIHREVFSTWKNSSKTSIPLDRLNKLKQLDLSNFPDLAKERDSTVNLAQSFLKNVNVSFTQTIDDTIFAGKLISTVINRGTLDIGDLDKLFQKRIGISSNLFLSVSSLIGDLIDAESYRIYSAYVSRSQIEIIEGKDDLQMQKLLPEIPEFGLTDDQKADEEEDARIVSSNIPREIFERINIVSSELDTLMRRYQEFVSNVDEQTGEIISTMALQTLELDADDATLSYLNTANSPFFEAKVSTRLKMIKQKELRLQWYNKRLMRLKYAMDTTHITRRSTDFFYTCLILICFPVLLIMIYNYDVTINIAASLIPKVETSPGSFIPSISWESSKAWNPVIEHVSGFLRYTGVFSKQKIVEDLLPCMPEDAPGIFARIGNAAFSKVAETLETTAGKIVTGTGNIALDMISEVSRTDGRILLGHIRTAFEREAGIFESVQLATFLAEDIGEYVLPLIPMFNAIHTIVSYKRNQWADIEQERPIAQTYRWWNRNKYFFVLSLAAYNLPYFIRLTALSIGRGAMLSIAAGGVTITSGLVGSIGMFKGLNALVSYIGTADQDISQEGYAREQLDRLASTIKQVDSGLLINAGNTALQLSNQAFSEQRRERAKIEIRREISLRLLDQYRAAVPEPSQTIVTSLLLTDAQTKQLEHKEQSLAIIENSKPTENDDNSSVDELSDGIDYAEEKRRLLAELGL